MVQYEHLRTASLYINNQLLSRGLLKDGQTIDFCDPDRCEGGTAEVMGKIMNVVNDLILRRDRDAEHRESLSTTLRTVRAESLRQTNDLARLTERCADTQRRLASAEASEKVAKSQLKAAESAIRGLKEEMARARTMVAQTRASCANEVRKRDRQIESLKKHVSDAGRTRGASRSNAITTINITGEFGSDERRGVDAAMGDDYDLSAETNQFLANLAKGLSAENDALLALVKRTLSSLREMGGLPKESQMMPKDGKIFAHQSNCEELSIDLDNILEHLRAILSNPSFVPIEEVEIREEEIQRLRGGWEKMETRWKEAVHLIDGWRRRMLSNGKGVNMEELKMGLRLSPVRVKDVVETSQGFGVLPLSAVKEEDEEAYENQELPESPCPRESLELVPAPGHEEDEGHDDSDSDASSIFHDDVELEDLDIEEPNIEILEQSIAIDDPLRLPTRPHQALQGSECLSDRGASDRAHARQKPGDFTTIVEEVTLEAEEASMPPPPRPVTMQEPIPQKHARPYPRNIRPPSPPPSNSSTSSTEQSQSQSKSRSQPQPQRQPRSRTQRPLPSRPTERPPTTRATAPQPSKAQPQPRSKSKPRRHTPSPIPPAEPISEPASQPASRSASGAESATATNPNADSTASTSSNTIATIRSTTPDSTDELALSKPSPEYAEGEQMRQNAQTPSRERWNWNGNGNGIERDRSPLRRAGSRLPLPANGVPPVQPSPQLTMASIAAKLAASEREADAARVRAKLKAARGAARTGARGCAKRVLETNPPAAIPSSSVGSVNSATAVSGEAEVEEGPVKKSRSQSQQQQQQGMSSVSSEEGGGVVLLTDSVGTGGTSREEEMMMAVGKPRKRERRASKVANRRRSTLSPWEMRSLITGQVAESPSK